MNDVPEAQLVRAVARFLRDRDSASVDEAVRDVCDATALYLQYLLQACDEWPQDRFVDGIMPVSIAADDEQALELAGGAVISNGTQWLVEPVLARFAIADDILGDFALLLANANCEPPEYGPELNFDELEFPENEDGWRYQFGIEVAAAD